MLETILDFITSHRTCLLKLIHQFRFIRQKNSRESWL